ncbi:alpha/beta hydrolase [Nocardioides lentus]|uniref:Alpha/beta hydrolase n=1 Tax=Nocardioides lentus TaxID=338077 RepID=A0ABN2P9K6_9ACTN
MAGRRAFLGLLPAALGVRLLTACGVVSGPQQGAPRREGDGVQEIAYGEGPSQFGELTRPEGTSRGVVVVIHGGFWRSEYDLSLGRPLVASLVAEGWTAWNLEYRRVGSGDGGGGGVPATLDDVAAGIDALADVTDLDTSTVITLGHSAGGHLAAWAAGRAATGRWGDVRVPVTAVVSQAGVLDLTAGADEGLGGGAVQAFVGAPPGPSYDEVDPRRQLPLPVPVRCVHGSGDTIVPPAQSTTYVEAARAAGADAEEVVVDGDHFVVIDPDSEAWTRTLEVLAELA